mmetsp:Transcript_59346/g.130008  ORF Transcript_59346/g.130008 Transcript_59346/m.130008 type:complete len:271 (+) Transcript_59346:957-1769(+)
MLHTVRGIIRLRRALPLQPQWLPPPRGLRRGRQCLRILPRAERLEICPVGRLPGECRPRPRRLPVGRWPERLGVVGGGVGPKIGLNVRLPFKGDGLAAGGWGTGWLCRLLLVGLRMVGLVMLLVVGLPLKRHSRSLGLGGWWSHVGLAIALRWVRFVVGFVGGGALERLLWPLLRLWTGLECLFVVPTVKSSVVRLVAGLPGERTRLSRLGGRHQAVLQSLAVGFSPKLRVVFPCWTQGKLFPLRWWWSLFGESTRIRSFVPCRVIRFVG